MANEARYEIMVPKVDGLGNPLVALAPHAVHYLSQSIPTTSVHIEPAHAAIAGGQQEPHDLVVITTEDLPAHDSTIKQAAAYVGDVANRESVLVTKHGPNGIQSWPIRNSQYQHGVPAESYILAPNARGPAVADPQADTLM